MDILAQCYENGFINFISGILFIFFLYHFILFFQQRITSYLYYSLYVLFLFFSIAPFGIGFLESVFTPEDFFLNFAIFSAEIAFVIYFLFALDFLNLKELNFKWFKIIRSVTYISGLAIILLQLIYLVTQNKSIEARTYEVFMIYILPVLALVSYIPFLKLKTPLKYYIIIGSLLVFLSSVITDAMAFYSGNERQEIGIYYGIYFVCIVIENAMFSLGLGHKQKLILQENKSSQEKIIAQYRENEKLKETIRQKLEENLKLASEKAEKEELEKLKVTYEKEMAELKITALKSQMNPHFIFNSLNSIKLYIIDNDKDNAVYYLNKFSKLIRKILSSTRERTVSLAEEIEILELYVNIENIRFENKINLDIKTDPNLNAETIQIPSLIFQPFVENAIWHGLPSVEGEKNIFINVERDCKFLKVVIEDNGIGRKKAAELKGKKVHKNKSVGINLTRERLKNFSKELSQDFSVEIEDKYDTQEKPSGTKVILNIPLV